MVASLRLAAGWLRARCPWSPGCATGLCWPPWRVFRPRSRWRCSPMRARCIPMRFSPPVPPSSHWRSRTTGPRGGGERTPRPRAGSPAPVDGAEDRVRGGAAVTALTASSSCSAPAASKTKPRLRQFLDACIRLGAIPVTVATGSKYQLLDFDPCPWKRALPATPQLPPRAFATSSCQARDQRDARLRRAPGPDDG